jgi:hypothetical protein
MRWIHHLGERGDRRMIELKVIRVRESVG